MRLPATQDLQQQQIHGRQKKPHVSSYQRSKLAPALGPLIYETTDFEEHSIGYGPVIEPDDTSRLEQNGYYQNSNDYDNRQRYNKGYRNPGLYEREEAREGGRGRMSNGESRGADASMPNNYSEDDEYMITDYYRPPLSSHDRGRNDSQGNYQGGNALIKSQDKYGSGNKRSLSSPSFRKNRINNGYDPPIEGYATNTGSYREYRDSNDTKIPSNYMVLTVNGDGSPQPEDTYWLKPEPILPDDVMVNRGYFSSTPSTPLPQHKDVANEDNSYPQRDDKIVASRQINSREARRPQEVSFATTTNDNDSHFNRETSRGDINAVRNGFPMDASFASSNFNPIIPGLGPPGQATLVNTPEFGSYTSSKSKSSTQKRPSPQRTFYAFQKMKEAINQYVSYLKVRINDMIRCYERTPVGFNTFSSERALKKLSQNFENKGKKSGYKAKTVGPSSMSNISKETPVSDYPNSPNPLLLEKKIKNAQRLLKHLEYHATKIDRLYDDYLQNHKLRDGAKTMSFAYCDPAISSSAKVMKESLVHLESERKNCDKNMFTIENRLQTLMGTFHFVIKEISGYARIGAGDQFDIAIKYDFPKFKKFSAKCKVDRRLDQMWDKRGRVYPLLLHEIMRLKAKEVKTLNNATLTKTTLDPLDLLSIIPILKYIKLTPNGSLKLNVLFFWNPLGNELAEELDFLYENSQFFDSFVSSKTPPEFVVSHLPPLMLDGGSGRGVKFSGDKAALEGSALERNGSNIVANENSSPRWKGERDDKEKRSIGRASAIGGVRRDQGRQPSRYQDYLSSSNYQSPNDVDSSSSLEKKYYSRPRFSNRQQRLPLYFEDDNFNSYAQNRGRERKGEPDNFYSRIPLGIQRIRNNNLVDERGYQEHQSSYRNNPVNVYATASNLPSDNFISQPFDQNQFEQQQQSSPLNEQPRLGQTQEFSFQNPPFQVYDDSKRQVQRQLSNSPYNNSYQQRPPSRDIPLNLNKDFQDVLHDLRHCSSTYKADGTDTGEFNDLRDIVEQFYEYLSYVDPNKNKSLGEQEIINDSPNIPGPSQTPSPIYRDLTKSDDFKLAKTDKKKNTFGNDIISTALKSFDFLSGDEKQKNSSRNKNRSKENYDYPQTPSNPNAAVNRGNDNIPFMDSGFDSSATGSLDRNISRQRQVITSGDWISTGDSSLDKCLRIHLAQVSRALKQLTINLKSNEEQDGGNMSINISMPLSRVKWLKIIKVQSLCLEIYFEIATHQASRDFNVVLAIINKYTNLNGWGNVNKIASFWGKALQGSSGSLSSPLSPYPNQILLIQARQFENCLEREYLPFLLKGHTQQIISLVFPKVIGEIQRIIVTPFVPSWNDMPQSEGNEMASMGVGNYITLLQLVFYLKLNIITDFKAHLDELAKELEFRDLFNAGNQNGLIKYILSLNNDLPPANSFDMICRLLCNNDEINRFTVTYLNSLSNHPEAKRKAVLRALACLESNDIIIRCGACRALQHLKATESINQLLNVFTNDPNVKVNESARIALLNLGPTGISAYEKFLANRLPASQQRNNGINHYSNGNQGIYNLGNYGNFNSDSQL
ncbi:unnamed protein product [Gordionus sp. m RMFG-2023]